MYCALEINQQNLRCTVIEVKQKLDDYINHAQKLLYSNKNNGRIDPNLASRINTCKDKEIAMVNQYYDRVIEALIEERDKHISEIIALSERNLAQLPAGSNSSKPHKGSKVDVKLNNF